MAPDRIAGRKDLRLVHASGVGVIGMRRVGVWGWVGVGRGSGAESHVKRGVYLVIGCVESVGHIVSIGKTVSSLTQLSQPAIADNTL